VGRREGEKEEFTEGGARLGLEGHARFLQEKDKEERTAGTGWGGGAGGSARAARRPSGPLPDVEGGETASAGVEGGERKRSSTRGAGRRRHSAAAGGGAAPATDQRGTGKTEQRRQ
jgi:hypothetical protein